MNVLDSNVEALAFNYLNFGLLTILNNLWTWVALLTAALSFWKIRSAGCPKLKQSDPITLRPDPVNEPLRPPFEAVTAETVAPGEKLTAVPVSGNGVAEDVDGVRKGKFTVYYEEDDMQCRRGESNGLLTVTAEGWEEGRESEWWKRWEKVLRFRNGENENGWYTCQDLTELNGNVVRFWDGGLRFGGGCFTGESWYSSSSCIIRL